MSQKFTPTETGLEKHSKRKRKSQFLPARVKIEDADFGYMTREEAISYGHACALTNKRFSLWQVGDHGWQTHTAAQGAALRKRPITPMVEFCALKLAVGDADASVTEKLFPNLVTKSDFGELNRINPSVVIGTVAITPVFVCAFQRGHFKWHVQSIDIDDHDDEYSNWNEALACATARAAFKAVSEAQKSGLFLLL